MAFDRIHAPMLPGLLALVLAACTSSPAPATGAVDASLTVEGTIASIDTRPWTYDGNAIVVVEAQDGRRVPVQLPARWNLCQATAVDVASLAVGMKVRASGSADGEGGLVVCQGASDRLERADAR